MMSLFPTQNKTKFMRLTYDRYRNLSLRVERNKLGRLPFSIQEMRVWVLDITHSVPGGHDPIVTCRYCRRVVAMQECDIDHAIPISRGGSLGFENMELICAGCNDQKGAMTPTEYLALLAFLEREIPLAMSDVLKRLGMAYQLAAGAAYTKKKKREANSGKDNKIDGVYQAQLQPRRVGRPRRGTRQRLPIS